MLAQIGGWRWAPAAPANRHKVPAMDLYGIRLVGLNEVNTSKLLVTLGLLAVLVLATVLLRGALRLLPDIHRVGRDFPFLWEELTVRLLTRPQGTRDVKDALSREVLAGLDATGIAIASATSEIVGFPTLKVQQVPASP